MRQWVEHVLCDVPPQLLVIPAVTPADIHFKIVLVTNVGFGELDSKHNVRVAHLNKVLVDIGLRVLSLPVAALSSF